MGALEFADMAVESIWKLVGVILHLGNIDFDAREDNGESIATISRKKEIDSIANLLQVNPEDLKQALLTRVIAAGGQVMQKPHTLNAAETSRESFAKALYDRLFTWIVGHVNSAIDPALTDSNRHQDATVIGVLDIYGFEVFDNNSFEQFCINYCNERLQQLFIELVLKQQQEEYESEGLEWVHIDYFNNQIICDLVDVPHKGVLALMDEACLNVGKTTDSMLLEAMDKKLKGNEDYTSRSIDSKENKNLVIGQDFVIRHYAGNVVYNVYGFIEKNRDTLFQDFKRLLYSSKNPIYKSMWPEGSHDIIKTTKSPLTAGTIFKNSMNELMKILASKEPFYVRCIKPNERKSPVTIDRERVIHQISYLGLLENVRVRRAGFAYRQDYTRFLDRYKMVCKRTWPNWRGSEIDGVKCLINQAKLNKDVTYGKTKLFMQSPESLFSFEEQREAAIPAIVTYIQKIWRGVQARRFFKKLQAALKVGLWYRKCVAKKYVTQVCSTYESVLRM